MKVLSVSFLRQFYKHIIVFFINKMMHAGVSEHTLKKFCYKLSYFQTGSIIKEIKIFIKFGLHKNVHHNNGEFNTEINYHKV